jgi:hypothetical protein
MSRSLDRLILERAVAAQSPIFRIGLNVEKHGLKLRPTQGQASQMFEHAAGPLRAIDHGENLHHADLAVE